MNATTSFVYLTDNLPKWIEQVKDLSTHVSKKHAEYAAECTRRLTYVRLKRERTPSLDSIHIQKDEQLQPSPPQVIEPPSESTPEVSTPTAPNISLLEASNKYLVQAQRKRKSTTSLRSGASGPPKFRSKHKVVVYYDAHIQEQLDSLVKSIGGARNNLRKGKLSRSVNIGFQLPSLGRTSVYNSCGTPSFSGPKKLSTSTSLPTDPKSQLASHRPTGNEAFTNADKHLEAAQNLCETAAHQVLRDGDCAIELNNVVKSLENALDLAIATVAQLREEDAEQQEGEADLNQTHPDTTPSADTSSPPSLTYSSTSKLVPSLDEKMEFSSRALAITSGGVMEIEVDDSSDQQSIVVDISKFRSTRTRSQGVQM